MLDLLDLIVPNMIYMNKNQICRFGKIPFVCFFLIFITLMAFAQPPVKELVLYFPLDAAGQQQIRDFSGQHNTGRSGEIVVSNSPSLVSMQQTRQLTFAVWIKPESIPSLFPVLLSKGGNEPGGAYGGYEFLLNANGDNDLVFVSGGCEFVTHNANGRWINNHLGEWIHVAFTIDDHAKIAQFYVNGQPTNDAFNEGSNDDLNFDLQNNLYVGAPDPASNANRSKFDGSMRDLMLFNRVLTAKEIQNIYKSTKPPAEKKAALPFL
jgi:hypothetical protein